MITGKNSFIKGFSLFALLTLAIVVLIATILAPYNLWIAGVLNTLVYGYIIYKLYKRWSQPNK